jgi:hypothetical protein
MKITYERNEDGGITIHVPRVQCEDLHKALEKLLYGESIGGPMYLATKQLEQALDDFLG